MLVDGRIDSTYVHYDEPTKYERCTIIFDDEKNESSMRLKKYVTGLNTKKKEI